MSRLEPKNASHVQDRQNPASSREMPMNRYTEKFGVLYKKMLLRPSRKVQGRLFPPTPYC